MRRIRSRFPHTLGFRVTSEQLRTVEKFADANLYTLGQAGRAILDAGIKELRLTKSRGESVDN